jgi:hypothetical protein
MALEANCPAATSHIRYTYAKLRAYARARVAHWIVDLLYENGIVLNEYRLAEGGGFDLVCTTSKVFTTDEPYPVTIDLPALTARRDAILNQVRAQA